VLDTGGKELYASPGAVDSWHDDPGSFTAGGMSGNGLFAVHLTNLFVNDTAMAQFRGEEDLGGRRAVRYDYRIPLLLSGYTIHLEYGQGRVAERGSFWVDPQSLDLLRLENHAEDIPATLPLVSAAQSVEYARTRIGDRDVLLPQSAVVEMLQTSGEWNRNALEFTHCQAFAAESKLSFDAPAVVAGPAPAAVREGPAPAPLPAGLAVTIELVAPLAAQMPVGSIVEARVAADVIDKKRVVIPAGAAVRGRIRRLDLPGEGHDYYVVGLEFTHIETAAGTARFYAMFQDVEKRGSVKLMLSSGSEVGPRHDWQTELTYLEYLPGIASFYVTGSRLDVPKGFRTMWKTTSPRSASR
jgi:hypothetical protein